MGWMVRGSNPGGGEIFRTCPDWTWGLPSLLHSGYRVFPKGKERPRRDADPSPLLVPQSWKGRAIPLLLLWAIRPVQSLSACTRAHFTCTFYPVCMGRTFATFVFLSDDNACNGMMTRTWWRTYGHDISLQNKEIRLKATTEILLEWKEMHHISWFFCVCMLGIPLGSAFIFSFLIVVKTDWYDKN